MVREQVKNLLTAVAYGTVSVTITLFNKAVFAYYKCGQSSQILFLNTL
jgi:hypothetical protein